MALAIDDLDMNRNAERLVQQRFAQRAGAVPQPQAASIRPQVTPGQPSPQAQAWNASRASGAGTTTTAAPRAAAPVAPASAPGGMTGAASKVRGVVNGAGGKLVTGLSVLNAIDNQTADDSTARYAQRFGVSEPTGDGSIGDISKFAALRMGGFASDLGNTMLMGLPQKYLYRDKPGDASQAPAPIEGTPGAAAAFAPPAAASAAAPGSRGTIYRKGNEFSDQPIAGGMEWKPAGQHVASANPNPLEAQARTRSQQRYADESEANENEARARQHQQIGSAINVARDYRSRQDAENRDKRLQSELHMAQWSNAGRTQINAIRGAIAQNSAGMDGNAAAPGRTPEQEQAVAASKQSGKIAAQNANEEGIAAGIRNDQLQRAAQIQQELDKIGSADPAARRDMIDRSLVSQGKDPDERRFITIDSMGPDGITALKSALDTRTGRIIGGGGVVGQQGGQPPSLEQFLKAAKSDARNKGQSDEQLTAYYKQKYGT